MRTTPPGNGGTLTIAAIEFDTNVPPKIMVEVHEHYRPTNDGYTPGIYRVVGTTDEMALLRVTDADGRRVATGELLHVSQNTLDTEFEFATNPDTGFSPIHGVRNALTGLYWSVRRFF
ncbi:hypothetical protein [Haladaptatus sp. DFWS20]|uniref:hypothetical protein n=1 Tax=Haladaptatus sp. DFWS20 TaxID=3403467 RepID=UPI003EBBD3DA